MKAIYLDKIKFSIIKIIIIMYKNFVFTVGPTGVPGHPMGVHFRTKQ